MHFSYAHNANGRKAGKFALVAGLHVAAGVLFVHSMNTRHISLFHLPDTMLVMLAPDPPAPPPPAQPPLPMPKLAPPPPVFVPKPEVDVAPPPDPTPLVTTTLSDPTPVPATPNAAADSTPTAPTAPSGPTSATPGRMHTAVFADANSCALPAYPPSAARNGDTGTTMLALLVGADGRVTSARVQHTSGSRELDRAAIGALSLCKFKPATNNGVPEAGWAQLAYVWTLD